MTPDVFLAEFGDLAETPGGPQRLRELVLKLAVQGCLTERKDDDGTVESLLHVVAANRETLAEKYRSRNGVSAGVEVPPFDAPDSWRWVPLGQLGVFLGGGTPSKKNRSFWAGRIPWVSPKDMKRPYIDDATDKITSEAVANSSAKLIPPRALLMVVRGMILAHSFPVALTTTEVTVNQDMKALLLGVPDLDEYLLRALQGSRDRMLAHVARSTHGTCRLDGQIVASFPVPVPPLAEQKRIVAKVDELLALCDELEAKQAKKAQVSVQLNKAALHAVVEAPDPKNLRRSWKRVEDNFDLLYDRIENVEELRRAIITLGLRGRLTVQHPDDGDASEVLRTAAEERAELLDGRRRGGRGRNAMGNGSPAPYSIPHRWAWCQLADVAGHIVDGTHHTPKYVEDGVNFISAKDIRFGAITFEGCRKITRQEFEQLSQRCLPKRGDVLVTKSGSIGQVAIVDTDAEFTLFESVALVPVVPSVSSEYVALAVYLSASGSFGRDRQKGVAVRHLHLVDLRQLPVPLPPRPEQDRIAMRVRELLAVCDDLEAKLKRADEDGERLMQAVVESLVA